MTSSSLRTRVRRRAEYRCEYCRLHESHSPTPMHVEHIVPRKHGGRTVFENLAYACDQCILHRGSDLVGIDSVTGLRTRLFNPRVDEWTEHFLLEGAEVVGLTGAGRVTVALLHMNDRDRRELRSEV